MKCFVLLFSFPGATKQDQEASKSSSDIQGESKSFLPETAGTSSSAPILTLGTAHTLPPPQHTHTLLLWSMPGESRLSLPQQQLGLTCCRHQACERQRSPADAFSSPILRQLNKQPDFSFNSLFIKISPERQQPMCLHYQRGRNEAPSLLPSPFLNLDVFVHPCLFARPPALLSLR